MEYLTVALLLVTLFLALTASGSILYWTFRNGIGPSPTSNKVRNHLLSNLPVLEQGNLYELGAGWGTLAFALADHFPERTVYAYETSTVPYLTCKLKQALHHRKNLKLHRSDLFHSNLDDAALVVCYLYPSAMKRLSTKFSAELPKNTVVISHTFRIPGWTPKQIIDCDDLYHTPIYIYKKS